METLPYPVKQALLEISDSQAYGNGMT